MKRPCLYILCGLPFAGKSTLAGEIAQTLGATYIDLDAINGERGLGLDGKPISGADWDETYREAYRRLDRSLQEGNPAIFDATNFTRGQRDTVRAIAEKLGLPARVIYVEVPENVVRERLQQNRETQKRFDVRDDDFAQVVDNFQPPTDEEDVLRYDQTLPIREWMRRHFNY